MGKVDWTCGLAQRQLRRPIDHSISQYWELTVKFLVAVLPVYRVTPNVTQKGSGKPLKPSFVLKIYNIILYYFPYFKCPSLHDIDS